MSLINLVKQTSSNKEIQGLRRFPEGFSLLSTQNQNELILKTIQISIEV